MFLYTRAFFVLHTYKKLTLFTTYFIQSILHYFKHFIWKCFKKS